MSKKKKGFEDFDSEEDKVYQNRLLIGILKVILNQKGELKADDVLRAYDQCSALSQQDIVFLAKQNLCEYRPHHLSEGEGVPAYIKIEFFSGWS